MKSVLAFSPKFFQLQKYIEEGIKQNGLSCVVLPDKPTERIAFRSLLRINPRLVRGKVSRYLRRVVKRIDQDPNYVLIFDGEPFLPEHIRFLRERFPSSRFVLYFWDSVGRYPGVLEKIPLFDDAITFNISDYQNNLFQRFLPLFSPDPFFQAKKETGPKENKIVFIGTAHPSKVQFINRFLDEIKGSNYTVDLHMYLPSRILLFLYKVFKRPYRRWPLKSFTRKKVTTEETIERYQRSVAALDAGLADEGGLSLRVFECLALEKKLIMPNGSIKKYWFYDPSRFLVWPDEKDNLDAFLSSPYLSLSQKEKEKLSTKRWIAEILSL